MSRRPPDNFRSAVFCHTMAQRSIAAGPKTSPRGAHKARSGLNNTQLLSSCFYIESSPLSFPLACSTLQFFRECVSLLRTQMCLRHLNNLGLDTCQKDELRLPDSPPSSVHEGSFERQLAWKFAFDEARPSPVESVYAMHGHS